jgi:RHS repeat-associated protein
MRYLQYLIIFILSLSFTGVYALDKQDDRIINKLTSTKSKIKERKYKEFRYYSPEEGQYISQDPIGLAGNNPTLYGYVHDSNSWVDPFGLSSNSVALGKALGSSPGINHDAHHIVMTGTQNAKMNSLVSQMQTHGIKIDGSENGIWLARTDGDKVSTSAGTSHKEDGLHGNAYKDEIYNRLNGKNKKDFRKELAKIKSELEAGRTWETKKTKKIGKSCR